MLAQEKVTREWDGMAGEWDDMAGGYRDEFVKLLWEETGFSSPESRSPLVILDFGCATGLLIEVVRKQVTKVVGMDVAPSMIGVLKNKIRSGEWDNVEAYCAIAAHLAKADPEAKAALEALKGKVDIVTASSVLSFVPQEDMEATIQFLGSLLKPETGILCHTDWPKGDKHPDGFTAEKALEMYQKGGLQSKTTREISMKMGGHEMPVFVGVATKKS